MPKVTRLDGMFTSTVAISDTRRYYGVPGVPRWLPSPDEIANAKGGYQIYTWMAETDETLRGAVRLLASAVAGPGYVIEARDKSLAAREIADTVAADIENLNGAFSVLLEELVSVALIVGHSLAEKVYDVEGSRVRLSALRSIAPHHVEFETTDKGDLLAISQRMAGGPMRMDPKKFVRFTNQGWHGSPWGTSSLKCCYRIWYAKTLWMQWLNCWGEKLATPPLVAKTTHPAQSPQIDEMLRVLDHVQAKTSLYLPPEVTLELLESSQAPRQLFLDVLRDFDSRLSRALLAPDRSGIAGPVESGSLALSSEQNKLWALCVGLIARQLEATLNESLIAQMVGLGWGDGAPVPRLRLLPVHDEDKAATAGLWRDMVVAGVVTHGPEDERRIRALLDFPESTEETPEAFRELSGWDRSARHGGRGSSSKASLSHPLSHSELLPTTRQSEPPPAATWRELTELERRADLVTLKETIENHSADLATTLAAGAADLVADLKAQVRSGALTPERVQNLKARPELVERVRQRIEAALNSAYDAGRQKALTELHAATTSNPVTKD